jgi:hypothetical protein
MFSVGNSLQPACGAIHQCQQVKETVLRCWQRTHQIHMHMAEPPLRDGYGLDRGPRLFGNLCTLAGHSVSGPGSHICLVPAKLNVLRAAYTWAGFQNVPCHAMYSLKDKLGSV